MACRKYRKLFSAYLDGDLDSEQHRGFEDHLAECRHCAMEFTGFKNVVALAADLSSIQPSPDFDTSLRAKLTHSANASESRSFFSRRRLLFAFSLVCLILVAFLSALIIHNNSTPAPQQNEDEPVRFLVGREVVPAFPSPTHENVFKSFVMPSVSVSASSSELEDVDMREENRTFVLPYIMGQQAQRDEPQRNYIIRRVSLTSTSDGSVL